MDAFSMNRNVVISYRTRQLPNQFFPKNIVQRPETIRIEGRRAFFKDGSSEEFDSILMVREKKVWIMYVYDVLFHLMQATGYLHHYPYFTDDLRLKARNEMFLKDLYKVKECSKWQTNIFFYFLDVRSKL